MLGSQGIYPSVSKACKVYIDSKLNIHLLVGTQFRSVIKNALCREQTL